MHASVGMVSVAWCPQAGQVILDKSCIGQAPSLQGAQAEDRPRRLRSPRRSFPETLVSQSCLALTRSSEHNKNIVDEFDRAAELGKASQRERARSARRAEFRRCCGATVGRRNGKAPLHFRCICSDRAAQGEASPRTRWSSACVSSCRCLCVAAPGYVWHRLALRPGPWRRERRRAIGRASPAAFAPNAACSRLRHGR
jgi:hypothetical protein